ncbi:MAG: hypothetical protein WKH64_16745 [Chloroflexia bacterium]
MRTLSAELLAAQRSRSQSPYIGISAANAAMGRAAADGVRASRRGRDRREVGAIAPDGSLCRMRITGAGDLYTQRIADPVNAPASAWFAWTLLAAGASGVLPPSMGSSSTLVNMATSSPMATPSCGGRA